jgi:hypothetical protein
LRNAEAIFCLLSNTAGQYSRLLKKQLAMKQHHLILGILMFVIQQGELWGQSFAPLGAEWCFHGRDIDFQYPNNSGPLRTNWVDHVIVEKDTVVAGQECRMLSIQRREKTNYNPNLIPKQSGHVFMYDNADTVFVYSDYYQMFVPLYIFTAQEQDTICLPVPVPQFTAGITSYCFVIDSIRTELFDTDTLRTFYTQPLNETNTYSVNVGTFKETAIGRYTEKLGGTWPRVGGFFPNRSAHSIHWYSIIGFPAGDLSFYSDSNKTIILSDMGCDSVVAPPSGIGKLTPNPTTINVYPNPATHSIRLKNAAVFSNESTLTISDALGRKVLQYKIPVGKKEVMVLVEHLNPGLYYLHLSGDDLDFRQKLIIRNSE